jgi:glycerol-3-phosphate O-acyltransferase
MDNDLEEIVLSYPKLIERMNEKGIGKDKVLKNLNEIKAEFSKKYIKTFETILDSTLGKLYDGIYFNENKIEFAKLVEENSVVLVPNHQSHADYLAINYMVYKNYRFPLYVAGGNNLNIFPIGPLFRKSGCFFIRRSFANDILYKLTLEAYLFYLLKKQKPIEFFFEGGRSRTGKLLPPRYGLYQMLLEAHRLLPEEGKKPLIFIPVSINHEYLPDQKALAREAAGGKKVKESSGQLLKLLGLFSKQFGSVHINLGEPVPVNMPDDDKDMKKITQDLAFKCFSTVGRNMVVTPTSLLALVMLDEPSGAIQWAEVKIKAMAITTFCVKFHVPVTDSLRIEKIDESLERAMDILVGNKKVEVIGGGSQQHIFYSIKNEARSELLFFKNTILHHFLLPWGINAAWLGLFSGEISSVQDLTQFFLRTRNQLKHEFYLPTTTDFLRNTLEIISEFVGREIHSLEECLELSNKDLYRIASQLSVFSRAMNYINEAYYTAALTIKFLSGEDGTLNFKTDSFNKAFKNIFDMELLTGRFIKYPESYSLPILRSSFKYFSNEGYLENLDGSYSIKNTKKFSDLVTRLETQLSESVTFNIGNT